MVIGMFVFFLADRWFQRSFLVGFTTRIRHQESHSWFIVQHYPTSVACLLSHVSLGVTISRCDSTGVTIHNTHKTTHCRSGYSGGCATPAPAPLLTLLPVLQFLPGGNHEMDSSPSSAEQRGPGPHHRNIPATTASSLSWPDMGAAPLPTHGATHHTAALSLEMCHLCIRSCLVKKEPKLWTM